MNRLLATCVILGGLALPAVAAEVEPVPILPEADECARCRMAVEEPRFAGELIASDGQVLKFDDIGCLRGYLQSKRAKGVKPKAIFVGDFATGAWLPLEKATFVTSSFPTPMRSGILAFSSPAGVKRLDKKYGARLVRWADLMKAK